MFYYLIQGTYCNIHLLHKSKLDKKVYLKINYMISKLKDIDIIPEDPFRNCKLGRQEYADILRQIVSIYDNGCVLAINGEWGTGKTTFVKMWQQHLNNNGFKTLYFNVWECDFIADPLIGLIGKFQDLNSNEKAKANYITLISNISKIILPIVPALIKGLLKKSLGEDAIEVVEAGVKSLSEICINEIQEFREQCKSIEEFRKALAELIGSYNSEKPLVFIVDELDRCNPAYAVKVLERTKHLFNIPNIVFVLSIDKKQLCNSVRGYYGSDLIDAEEYLKRFIDIEYHLPEPDIDKFCDYLYEAYQYSEFFKNREHKDSEQESFQAMAKILFLYKHLKLRDMEKIFAHVRLVVKTASPRTCIYPEVIFLLTYFRLYENNIYQDIKNKKYSVDELVAIIENKLPIDELLKIESSNDYPFQIISTSIARLLSSYVLNRNGNPKTELIETISPEKYELTFKTKYFNTLAMIHLLNYYKFDRYPLQYTVNHIDLLTRLQEN